jgi:hypothetical protein
MRVLMESGRVSGRNAVNVSMLVVGRGCLPGGRREEKGNVEGP